MILPRSTWDNSPDLNALLTWIPQNQTFPSDWQTVERIVIHHSATPNNDPYPAISRIQSIYRFHSITQGWGDIGYSYIIDQQGKIYEGRFGGNGSRGAHVYDQKDSDNYNYGSTGIVLLGTYTDQDVSPQMYDSLSRLVGWLTAVNGLDPQTTKTSSIWNTSTQAFSSTFSGYIVLGHKDIESTQCPGIVSVPKIRQEAAGFRNKYQNYAYQVNGSGTIYKIDNGVRKSYSTLADLTAAGATYSKLANINKTQLDLFSGERFYKFFAGALIKSMNSPTIYLVDTDLRIRPFNTSPTQFLNLGFSFEKVNIIPQDEMTFYVVGKPVLYGPESALVKKQSDPSVYYIEKGRKRQIGSVGIFNFFGFLWTKVKTLTDGEIDSYLAGSPMSYPEGGLVKSDKSPAVYLINSGQLHQILSAGIFESMGLKWGNIKTIPDSEINSFAIASPAKHADGTLVKSADSPNIYVIRNGIKELIPSAEAFNTAGYNWSKIITLASGDIAALYPETGSAVAGASINLTSEPTIRVGIYSVPQGQEVVVNGSGQYKYCDISNNCQSKIGETRIAYSTSAFAKFIPEGATILEISSYTDMNWNKTANYNKFRGSLEIKYSNKSQKLWVVNELGLEDYLKGIGEVSQSDEYGYIKTLIVAARTYAYYYIKLGGKFGADEIYHLDNTPGCQLYKGYGREGFAPSIVQSVNETRGEIITYNSQPIVSAYSSGAVEVFQTGTRSACSVWGGKFCQTGYEYLSGGVKDPEGAPYTRTTCGADNHCVGMSAAGGRRFVALGKSYKEILTYYYKGTSINKVY
jgi:peptidoglycan hydrolase-like amidase